MQLWTFNAGCGNSVQHAIFFLAVLWLVGSSFPDQGWNLAQGSESVESTGPPGNSLNMLLSAGYI